MSAHEKAEIVGIETTRATRSSKRVLIVEILLFVVSFEVTLPGLGIGKQLRKPLGGFATSGVLAPDFLEFCFGGHQLGFLDEAGERRLALPVDTAVGYELERGTKKGDIAEGAQRDALIDHEHSDDGHRGSGHRRHDVPEVPDDHSGCPGCAGGVLFC